MKTIVFIETNKSGSSREAIKSAEKLGYFTVLFTNREKTLLQREEYPDVHHMIYTDLTDINGLIEKLHSLKSKGLKIKLIVSFVDPYVYTASRLADEFLESNYLNTEAILKMENKSLTRITLQDKPYTPFFTLYDNKCSKIEFIEQHKSKLPLIVKSPNSTGSKDVFFAENEFQLEQQIEQLLDCYPNEPILLEEFIEGPQYLVEVVINNNEVNIIAVIEQEITENPPFIVTGYSVLSEADQEKLTQLKEIIVSIISTLHYDFGALHLELRYSQAGWKLIEVNPRISGGAMNTMLQHALGINLVEKTLQLYLGEEVSFASKYKKNVFTQHVTSSLKGILQKVSGKNKALQSPGVVAVYVKPKKGTKISPPLSMGMRYAYVIAVGETSEEARRYAKLAAEEITFHLES